MSRCSSCHKYYKYCQCQNYFAFDKHNYGYTKKNGLYLGESPKKSCTKINISCDSEESCKQIDISCDNENSCKKNNKLYENRLYLNQKSSKHTKKNHSDHHHQHKHSNNHHEHIHHKYPTHQHKHSNSHHEHIHHKYPTHQHKCNYSDHRYPKNYYSHQHHLDYHSEFGCNHTKDIYYPKLNCRRKYKGRIPKFNYFTNTHGLISDHCLCLRSHTNEHIHDRKCCYQNSAKYYAGTIDYGSVSQKCAPNVHCKHYYH